MGFNVDFKKIYKRFDDMEKKVRNGIIDKALDAGTKPIMNSLDNNIPIDSGAMKATIGVYKKTGDGLNRTFKIGAKTTDKKILARYFYTNYGTRYMSGTMWVRKSARESKEEAIKEVKRVVLEELIGGR